MLVFGSLLLCISALVNGDNVTLGIKKDDNVMNTRSCIYKERQDLHLFKANLVDTFNSLVDWSSEGEKRDCRKWQGVICDKLTGRVIEIDLSSFVGLAGSIPFFLGGLTSLTYLDLSGNRLVGVIPLSFNNCSSLVQLNLSENFLIGSVPSLAGCASLNNLSLGHNFFNGSIPDFNGCFVECGQTFFGCVANRPPV
uniref:LRR receptor-like serine/threonine-protein kinase GSO2 n=1 Tax=Tanacetum cinerariifolium TaxID=118510 RepID=A0A699KNK5_TANCI|nr:LRR receptor-like serine/threonine-protein kinase GSO2 [Tanacetum cinerariifolium]